LNEVNNSQVTMTNTTRFTGAGGFRTSMSWRHFKRVSDFHLSVAGFGVLEN